MSALRRRVHEVLGGRAADRAAHVVHSMLASLIVLNVAAFVAGSHALIAARFGGALAAIETVSVIAFTVEYVLRLWAAAEAFPDLAPWRARLRIALHPLMIVDLLAILPFWLPMVSADLRPLRILRVLRLLRILKLGRYSSAMQLLGRVVRNARHELAATTTVVGLLLLLASCLIWLAEREAQPEAFSSVTASAWWAIATLTTVGYGDVVPVTPLGRVVGGLVALSGVVVIALPAAILASGMMEELRSDRARHGSHSGSSEA